MILNAPLEIEIYVTTEQVREKQKLDIDFDYSECDLKTATFYNIDAIYPCTEMNKEVGCYICCNGSEIVTPLSYEEIKSKINKRI